MCSVEFTAPICIWPLQEQNILPRDAECNHVMQNATTWCRMQPRDAQCNHCFFHITQHSLGSQLTWLRLHNRWSACYRTGNTDHRGHCPPMPTRDWSQSEQRSQDRYKRFVDVVRIVPQARHQRRTAEAPELVRFQQRIARNREFPAHVVVASATLSDRPCITGRKDAH